MAKGRNPAKGYVSRRVDIRNVRQRFLIVCEGERTEPAYFEGFRAPRFVVRVDYGSSDPLRLVKEACDRWDREKDFDQVWCVFDRDDAPADRFNNALELAKQRSVRVAYSNQAFELWFLLHFQTCNGPLTRQDLIRRLNGYLKRPYRKNDPGMYALLEPYMEPAIERAERLLAGYDPSQPAHDDPSTAVHLLVQELRRFSHR